MTPSGERPDLIAQLVAEAAPVRRLWSPVRRLAVWLGLAAMLAGLVLAMGPRPDIAARLQEPVFLLEMVVLALVGTLLASQALRHAVPGMASNRLGGVVGLTGLLGVLLLREPMQLALSLDSFVAVGAPCAGTGFGFVGGPWVALVIALRRGAPLSAARAGALAGGAAAAVAFLLLRLWCPVDELLHVLVWHALPLVAAGVGCTALGAWWLRRWRRANRTSP